MQIYLITNLINKKIYIGQDSKNRPNYFGSGIIINHSIKKHGKENFSKIILSECNSFEVLNELEIFWIKHYNSTNKNIGYNLTPGGNGAGIGKTHVNYGKKLSIGEKEKIRKSVNKYYKEHPEAKIEMSKQKKGKYAGEKNPMYGQGHKVAGEKNGRFGGKGTTDETRRKISESATDRIVSYETCKKLSKKTKGKNNPMYGKSAYSIWVEKYGKDEADKRKKLTLEKRLKTLQKQKDFLKTLR